MRKWFALLCLTMALLLAGCKEKVTIGGTEYPVDITELDLSCRGELAARSVNALRCRPKDDVAERSVGSCRFYPPHIGGNSFLFTHLSFLQSG